MSLGRTMIERGAPRFNKVVLKLRSSRLLGPSLRRGLTVVTYTGRRSGRTFSTPVSYRRDGDTVKIAVAIPETKKWWRNFTGAGGPLSLELDGVQRDGHAVAERAGRNRVELVVRLTPR